MSEYEELPDLASDRLGGAAIATNDDFFAPKENLVKAAPAVWLEHEYTERGKWMDGWESRRKRTAGHDWCIVRLGAPAIVRGFVIDTSFFRGNFPSHASIDGCFEREPLEGTPWIELLPKSELKGDARNSFAAKGGHLITHLRLNIFPDGGVARLRVHGHAIPDFRRLGGGGADFDLAAIENGGRSLACSDMFFGNRHNLLMPGRAVNMSDGWETRRRRGPGHDWNLVALAGRARIRAIELDTSHFKGNFPDTCSVEACDGDPEKTAEWHEVLVRTKLQAHTRHVFVEELADDGPATHVRLNVFPDGGVSRMRVFGTLTEDARIALGLSRIAALPRSACERELLACCGSRAWAASVAGERPYASEEELRRTSDRVWSSLTREDWLEAFAAHPAIGGATKSRWSQDEQKGMSIAPPEAARTMIEENERYRKKFGHVFLVCATGKTADELLAALRARIGNDPQKEIDVAAEEQRKITHLRLRRLLLG